MILINIKPEKIGNLFCGITLLYNIVLPKFKMNFICIENN